MPLTLGSNNHRIRSTIYNHFLLNFTIIVKHPHHHYLTAILLAGLTRGGLGASLHTDTPRVVILQNPLQHRPLVSAPQQRGVLQAQVWP